MTYTSLKQICNAATASDLVGYVEKCFICGLTILNKLASTVHIAGRERAYWRLTNMMTFTVVLGTDPLLSLPSDCLNLILALKIKSQPTT